MNCHLLARPRACGPGPSHRRLPSLHHAPTKAAPARASSAGVGHAQSPAAPGLLLVPGLLSPDALRQLADEATEACQLLQCGAVMAAESGCAGPTLVGMLLKLEAVAADVIRPARYLQDYHRDPDWQSAARAARQQLQQALERTWQQQELRDALQRSELELVDILRQQQIWSQARRRRGAGTELARAGETTLEWLGACRHLLRLCRGSGANADSSDAAAAAAATQLQSATCAFHALSNSPALSPVLLLHPKQQEALAQWLPDAQQPAEAASEREAPPLSPPPHVCLDTEQAVPGGGGKKGGAVAASTRLPDGGELPTDVVLHQEAVLQLGDTLLDRSDMAADLVQQQAGTPVAARLTHRAVQHILQGHPDEGVRWQVYQSGLLKRQRVLLLALDEVSRLRNQLAGMRVGAPDTHSAPRQEERGAVGSPQLAASRQLPSEAPALPPATASYADMLLDGSLAGNPAAAASFLKTLAAALRQHADADVASLKRLARWPGVDLLPPVQPEQQPRRHHPGSAPPTASDSRPDTAELDGWNLDYLLALSAQKRRGGSAACWEDFWDYFTVDSVIEGANKLLRRSMGLAFSEQQTQQGSDEHLESWGLGGSVRTLQVIDEERGVLGTLLLHLHSDGSEYPFTALIRHGNLWSPQGPAAPPDEDTGLPVVLIRLQHPDERAHQPGSELPGRLHSPYFLRALLHELGHALHYLCSGPAVVPGLDLSSSGSTGFGGDGGSWQGPLPPPAQLSAAHCPLDLKELPSHLLEHWVRCPSTLQVLSRHQRLGTPLPPRDAARLSEYLSTCFYHTSLDLHDSVLTAFADLHIHGATSEASTPSEPQSASEGGRGADGQDGQHAPNAGRATSIWSTVWSKYGVLPGVPATLERVRNLEALGTVGGAKYVYVYCKVLAAATWKVYFEQEPLDPDAGRRVKRLLLCAGAQHDPAAVVRSLLGPGSLKQVYGGWVPDLQADVFQDIELLG